MRVRVLFFGRLKDIVGCAEDWAEVPEGSSVEQLFARYSRQFTELTVHRATLAASVNEELAEWNTLLRARDEVAFLPPVSGGAPVSTAQDICELTRQPIAAGEIIAAVKSPGDGAVCVFDGIVRNHSRGRATLHLEYDAYEPMALKTLRALIAECRHRFAVDRIAVVHRLGRLDIGETSVLIAVSAPHRAAAFDACRFLIETLKRSVPIWKKEFFADGAVWAEGQTPAPVGNAAEAATKPLAPSGESNS
jgi:molybdopterin synthase catalytic subunit